MALKDLVADHRKLTEETIEQIVAPYVRYDPAARKIIPTPQGRDLTNDARVLTYLVAVQGWQYVSDEIWEVATKPADLEAELGIPGGTLRPILKKLKDARLLAVADGHYRVQVANLDAIRSAITGESVSIRTRERRPSRGKPKSPEGPTTDRQSSARKKTASAAGGLKASLILWVSEGFFSEPRTISDLLQRYHEHGIIAKQTSLSGLLLDAVRDRVLSRTKVEAGGKEIWAYRARG